MLRCLKVAILAAFAAMLIAGPAQAAGQLDREFGNGGRLAVAPVASGFPNGDIARAPDGSVFIANDRYLAHILPGGRFDTSFGTDGFATIEPGSGFAGFYLADLLVDGSGRPLVLGTGLGPRSTASLLYSTANFTTPVAIRFQPDGNLDPTFSAGGVMTNDFGIEAYLPGSGSFPMAGIASAGLDAQGRTILAVTETIPRRGYFDSPVRLLARLDQNGNVDPSFGGGDGMATVVGDTSGVDIVLDQGGSITLVGSPAEYHKLRYKLVLQRFDQDGQPDASFGSSGRRVYGRGGRAVAVATNRSGEIAVLGTWSAGERVFRLHANGRPVRGFGRAGVRGLPYEEQGRSLLRSRLLLDRGGRVLLLGELRDTSDGRAEQAIERLLPSGGLDRGFGRDGTVLTGFGSAFYTAPLGAIFTGTGLLTVGVGQWSSPGSQEPAFWSGFLLARYRLGG